MPAPLWYIAKGIAQVLGVSVEVVWQIIRQLRTTDIDRMVREVKKVLQMP